MNDPLTQLQDIHLPQTISWWPLSPALWGLLVVTLVMLAALLWWAFVSYRRNRYRRLTRKSIAHHFSDYQQHNNQQQLCRQLFSTLRRCLLTSANIELAAAASYSLSNLLTVADQPGKTLFSRELIALVEQQLYAPKPQPLSDEQLQQLRQNALQWVKQVNTAKLTPEVPSHG
ncbi:DUF4381 domain-containing protein [bacterium SCSIO 12696]|nr:DUF4381 domain-containing protein [bacterium SCSIO 12696]